MFLSLLAVGNYMLLHNVATCCANGIYTYTLPLNVDIKVKKMTGFHFSNSSLKLKYTEFHLLLHQREIFDMFFNERQQILFSYLM